MKYYSSQFLTNLTVKIFERGMLHVICSNCQLFQYALFIKVLRWNLPWLESLFLRLLMTLFLCWGWEPGFHLSALICCDLPEAVGSLLALPCKDMHQPHLLCIWSTLWEPQESSLSVDSDPYFPSQVSTLRNIGWSNPVSLWALLWDGYSAVSYTQHMLK